MDARAALIWTALILAVPLQQSSAQEWTRFRGPNGTGIAEAAPVPVQWTEDDYNWKVELPGVGHSSPVIWGDRIFLTSAISEDARRFVLCYRTTDGQLLWARDFGLAPHTKHQRNSFASSTPALDADHVYVTWTDPQRYTLMALDHHGNDVWNRDLGTFESQHSGGTSPIVYGELVVIGSDQDGQSSLVAVDRLTGRDRWRTPRRPSFVAYSTPCVYKPPGGSVELIFNSGSHGISGIDPKTGKTNWELAVFDKRSVSSPVLADGLLIGSCGSGAGGNYVVAVRPGNIERNIEPQLAYKIDRSAPYVPTPLAKGDLLFLWSDKGVVTCVRAASGTTLWQQRVGGNFSGSPVCVGDRLYCISDEGDVFVLAAAEKFELLGRNPLGEPSRATPAVAGGSMYLRTYSHLVSIGGKSSTAAATGN